MYLTIGGGGEECKSKDLYCKYSKKIFARTAKPIRIIGQPNNQLSNKWSSTVLVITNPF